MPISPHETDLLSASLRRPIQTLEALLKDLNETKLPLGYIFKRLREIESLLRQIRERHGNTSWTGL